MKQFRLALLALATALLVIGLGSPVASAVSTSSATLSTSSGLVQVKTPYGVAGWASKDYISEHPGAIAGLAVVNGKIVQSVSTASSVQLQSRSSAAVHPDSADGCNRNVCIDIEGFSLVVTQWTSTAHGNVGCSFTQFQRTNSPPVNGPTICPSGSGQGVYYDSTGPIGIFRNNDRVCNVWRGIAGRPCETIES